MDLLQSIHELPRNEKLSIMEYIWKDLSEEETDYKSPEWHQKVLKDTETRWKDGEEKEIDWEDAKKKLRMNSE
ncbi:MAG: addiction module protein [Proteobacteria bacterium]|nr:addiction module protein [Pseudomonadota bacterium]